MDTQRWEHTELAHTALDAGATDRALWHALYAWPRDEEDARIRPPKAETLEAMVRAAPKAFESAPLFDTPKEVQRFAERNGVIYLTEENEIKIRLFETGQDEPVYASDKEVQKFHFTHDAGSLVVLLKSETGDTIVIDGFPIERDQGVELGMILGGKQFFVEGGDLFRIDLRTKNVEKVGGGGDVRAEVFIGRTDEHVVFYGDDTLILIGDRDERVHVQLPRDTLFEIFTVGNLILPATLTDGIHVYRKKTGGFEKYGTVNYLPVQILRASGKLIARHGSVNDLIDIARNEIVELAGSENPYITFLHNTESHALFKTIVNPDALGIVDLERAAVDPRVRYVPFRPHSTFILESGDGYLSLFDTNRIVRFGPNNFSFACSHIDSVTLAEMNGAFDRPICTDTHRPPGIRLSGN